MKKYKKDSNLTYSIGVFPTLELLQNRIDAVVRVLVSSKGAKNTGLGEIRKLCSNKSIALETADTAIEKLSDSENTYAIGVFKKYQSYLENGNHLVLVNPSDKGNLGTIIRTMAAFNVNNLAIIKPSVDIFDPKVIRASMGAIFKLNFEHFNSFSEYQSRFKNNYFPFITNGKYKLPEVRFNTPFSLIFGNEGAGLDNSYSNVGSTIQIPQSSGVDSLNLSVAVGIGLYASSQQK